MSPKAHTVQRWSLASVALRDAYTDFILSRQAIRCSPATIEFYRWTAGAFLEELERQGVGSPQEITPRHVRERLAELVAQGKTDWTVHDHARGVKTLLKFMHKEHYLPAPIDFDMPRRLDKWLPALTADQLNQVLTLQLSRRDRALILFLVDSGVRRGELCALNWADVDIASGLVMVRHGKGDKDRSSVIGVDTRRALLAYRRSIDSPADDSPLFLTRLGRRMTAASIQHMFGRLSKLTGLEITAHALRRTFVKLSLRLGMDSIQVQRLGGWASLDMVSYYARLDDEDLLQAHRAHSPIDNLDQLRQSNPRTGVPARRRKGDMP